MTENENIGYLKVKVSTANSAFPVEGAVVLISSESDSGEGALLYSLRTNESGLTRSVPLLTKPAFESESPGYEKPYLAYSVRVTADKYLPVNISGVSVFEGIEATLPVTLIPSAINPVARTDGGEEGRP